MSTENLNRAEGIKKLKELSEKARICMFCTDLESLPVKGRPMSIQECDEEGNLWFISSAESNKNFEIGADDRVQLYFMNNSNSEYLSVYGKAAIYRDRTTIEDKWSNMANAWFDGKYDPDVTIIRVSPVDTFYWDTKYGKVVSLFNFAVAAVSGKNTDNSDGVEGSINV